MIGNPEDPKWLLPEKIMTIEEVCSKICLYHRTFSRDNYLTGFQSKRE